MGKHTVGMRAPSHMAPRTALTQRAAVAPAVAVAVAVAPRLPLPSTKRFGNQRRPLIVGAFVIIMGVLLVNIVDPYSGALASPYYQVAPRFTQDSQTLLLAGEYDTGTTRDAFSVTAKPAPAAAAEAAAPAAGVPDPDSAQAIALGIIAQHGWGTDQYNCLVSLWNRESRWNVYAHNTSSGAYGIPQSLPGEKMATAGADWQTNPTTQIIWGLGYIEGRYGSPCGAWAHSEDRGWY